METEKSSSIFSSVLIVIILLGLVILYLMRDKDVTTPVVDQSEVPAQSVQVENQESEPGNQTEVNAGLEAEIESLDTEFEDMNVEDLDM